MQQAARSLEATWRRVAGSAVVFGVHAHSAASIA